MIYGNITLQDVNEAIRLTTTICVYQTRVHGMQAVKAGDTDFPQKKKKKKHTKKKKYYTNWYPSLTCVALLCAIGQC